MESTSKWNKIFLLRFSNKIVKALFIPSQSSSHLANENKTLKGILSVHLTLMVRKK